MTGRALGSALRLGVPAVWIDRDTGKVWFGDGAALAYDHLVIATGIVPRRLPFGAGFIGCEAAAALRGRGLDVVVVEPRPAPLAGALGAEIGGLVARLHTAAGVDLRCGTGVAELLGEDRVRGARLSDGSEVAADLVLSGIGSRPAVDWLDGSGLELGRGGVSGVTGILCDEHGRTSHPRVWAVGDVAAWWHPALGEHLRVEHWTRAGEQAAAVARGICGIEAPAETVPYFWSDQHGVKIQALGHFRPGDEARVLQDDGRKFVAVYSRDGVLTGAVGCGMPAKVLKYRPLPARGATLAEVP